MHKIPLMLQYLNVSIQLVISTTKVSYTQCTKHLDHLKYNICVNRKTKRRNMVIHRN